MDTTKRTLSLNSTWKRLPDIGNFVNHTASFLDFNTIITSLKALDEGFSSKNYVRKFLRALHPKWRAKVTKIEESKDLSSLALDELIGNLKVHEVVMEKDSEIYRGKKERVKSIALKAKKESSDDETSTSESDDKEYVMAVRNFKKCADPNHLIGDCLKPPRNKDQKAFIGGSWSDSENEAEEKTNDETGLMAQSSNESPSCKIGLGFDSSKASKSGTKPISFVGSSVENATDESTIPGSVDPPSMLQTHDGKHKSILNLQSIRWRCLELLHMDLFGPSAIKSYGGNLYTLVVVDDYSRYTWTRFLKTKNEAFEKFEILSKKIQNQLGSSIVAIRMDHGWEFDNEVQFRAFCDAQGISHNFSAPRTPQSNEHTMKVEESLNVTLNESPPPTKLSPLVDDDIGEEKAIENNIKVVNNNNIEDESIEVDNVINIKESKNHPLEQVIERAMVFAHVMLIIDLNQIVIFCLEMLVPGHAVDIILLLVSLSDNKSSCGDCVDVRSGFPVQ
ncbi:retrovirus-related pol polyprotein from transposon TNT 1-94 [Tanacetum coccineum]